MVRQRGRGRGRARDAGSTRGGGRGRGRPTARPTAVATSTTSIAACDEGEMLNVGLALVGFPESRQNVVRATNIERFRAFYGVDPKSGFDISVALQAKMTTFSIADMLMTFSWLRLYETEHVLSGRWGLHVETIRNKVRSYVTFIQSLLADKVRWGPFDVNEVFLVTVDGVHCRIAEPRTDPGSKWYDHKTNSAGVAYEVALAIRSSTVASIRGPFPASAHDLTIFRGGKKDEEKNPDALIFKIPPGKKAIADSAYEGEAGADGKISISRAGDSDEVKQYKARAKARQETFNSRLKSFQVLDLRFRHGYKRHKAAFEAVATLVIYDMENGRELFEI